MIVHLADDIEKFVATVRERETWVDPIWDIRREWQTPDGERQTIRFRVTKPVPGGAPFTINAYQPNVIGQYLQDRFRHHANGARHVAAVTGVAGARQFAPAVAYFEDLYGVSAQRAGEGVAEIKPRDVTLRIVTAAAFAGLYPEIGPTPLRLPCLAAVTIEVSDLHGVARLLAANDVSHVRQGQSAGIVVGPHEACGVTFEFVPAYAGCPSGLPATGGCHLNRTRSVIVAMSRCEATSDMLLRKAANRTTALARQPACRVKTVRASCIRDRPRPGRASEQARSHKVELPRLPSEAPPFRGLAPRCLWQQRPLQ